MSAVSAFGDRRSSSSAPTYISLPPPDFPQHSSGSSGSSSNNNNNNNADSRGMPMLRDSVDASPLSPALHFYTAPSTPADVPDETNPTQHTIQVHPANQQHQLTSHHQRPHSAVDIVRPSPGGSTSPIDDTFPTELPAEISTLEDYDGLTALEKVFVCATSKKRFHRSFIAHALPQLLKQIPPKDAVTYVLPLLTTLAMDQEDAVKDALATQLASIIWWFFTKCNLTAEDPASAPPSIPPSPLNLPPPLEASQQEQSYFHPAHVLATLSVQSFTPILGTLLLSPNTNIGAKARSVVVQLLNRLQTPHDPTEDETDHGLLNDTSRAMVENEILQQIILGMGRLYEECSEDDDEYGTALEEVPPEPLIQEEEEDRLPERGRTNQEGSRAVEGERAKVYVDVEMGQASPTSEPGKQKARWDKINPYFPVFPSDIPSPGSSTDSSPSTEKGSSPSKSLSPLAKPHRSTMSPRRSPLGHAPAIAVSSPLSSSQQSDLPEQNNYHRKSHSKSDSLSSNSNSFSPRGEPTNLAPASNEYLAPPQPQSPPPTSVPPKSPQSIALSTTPPPVSYRYMFERKREPESAGSPRFSPQSSVQDDVVMSGYGDEGDGVGGEEGEVEEDYDFDGEHDGHWQAAVGRLSSMSLIAAVASNGVLSEDAKKSFVAEVERVGGDRVYWVRREAAFALGALAKIVSVELVVGSLLPVFEKLCSDAISHVRHSALFALPAILAGLSRAERWRLGLEVIMAHSKDQDASIRLAVLEVLGEVIYTFHNDDGGPPEELVQLFLGQPHQPSASDVHIRDQGGGGGGGGGGRGITRTNPLAFLAQEEERQRKETEDLIRGFNFPAVTLTLGRTRWKDGLRGTYLRLSQGHSVKLRRTLAASVGEMAKIIGPDQAREDLVGLWWDFLKSDEEVRIKLVESLEALVGALDIPSRVELVRGVLRVWNEGGWNCWREREGLAGTYQVLCGLVGAEDPDVMRGLVNVALQDPVAAVREAAIRVIPTLWELFTPNLAILNRFKDDLVGLAQSGVYRRRITFIGCLHSLITHKPPLIALDHPFFEYLPILAGDSIPGIRIGVARLVGYISKHLNASTIPPFIRDVHRQLTRDVLQDVRSFVAMDTSLPSPSVHPSALTFSRPP